MSNSNIPATGPSAAALGSLPVVGSEFLVARWQAKAEALEEQAEKYRETMTGMVAMTLEKARAYRACILDLRWHTEASPPRQPKGNNPVLPQGE